jgi:hypothetical protein
VPFALTLGCGGGNKSVETGGNTQAMGGANSDGSDDVHVPKVDESLCDTKDKKIVTFDLNKDNQPDVWKLLATHDERGTTIETMTCKQVDIDHDGKKDYVARFDESGATLTEEYDFDFDSKFDTRYHFDKKTGKRYLVERQTTFAAKPDIWEKYDKEERLESMRRDRNGDGKPDYWEQYTGGILDKILYDDDFDGRVDRQDEVQAKK